MRKLLAVMLIIGGLAVFLYPHLYTFYRDYRVEQSLEEFGESKRAEGGHEVELPSEAREEEEGGEEEKSREGPRPIAVLKIEKIDLELPVFQGTSDKKLDYGAGLLEDTAGFGEKGSTVITAHRAHSYGRLFNRLDELGEGDRVTVKTKGKSFAYRVYRTGIFKAEDTSYLSCAEQEKRLVLVTCHPLYQPNPPYRLVVEAGKT